MIDSGSPLLDAAVLGDVGRKKVRFALSDEQGRLRADTVRSYEAAATSSIAGALSMFQRDLSLKRLPTRSAIAVAGLARGDAISITDTRWFLSRSGLQAMLGTLPVVINDFAAEAWAFYSLDQRPAEVFAGAADFSVRRPGCYCVMGMTSGLGVAILTTQGNTVTVIPTEAGHAGFVAGSEELAWLLDACFPGQQPVPVEKLVSAPGLLCIYAALAHQNGSPVRVKTPEDVTRSIAADPLSRRACELLCKAFWSYAGNLVLTYGAWDGVILTGGLATALRPILRLPEMQPVFAGKGKYQRVLQGVARAVMSVGDAELVGAAEALRHQSGSAADA